MTSYRTAAALALVLALGACSSVADYTASEAPKNLTVETATTRVDVRFAAGSARLAAADAVRLRNLAAAGAIAPADRIIVAAAGHPRLAEQRVAAVAAELLHYGIVVGSRTLPQLPPNQAILEIARSLVTLPPCPNWSRRASADFTNAPSSNFGCANSTNLGLMVANPGDLASGRPVGSAAGQPAAAAMTRYLNDKVVLPTANSNLPIPSASSPSTGGSQ